MNLIDDYPLATRSPFLNIREVAMLLSVPRATLSRWRRERIGPAFIQQGKFIRYEIRAVQEWLDAHEVTAITTAGGSESGQFP